MDKEEKKLLIEELKMLENSRFEPSKQRELSAWAMAVFYISFLGILFNYFNTKRLYISWEYIFLGIIIFLFFIVVVVFIHAQYAISNYVNTDRWVITRLLFEIITGKINLDELDEKDWKIGDVHSYPNFIQDRLEIKVKENHKWANIYPFVIFCWFFKVIKAKICKEEPPKNEKIHLVESSLYCTVLLPTILVLVLLIVKVVL